MRVEVLREVWGGWGAALHVSFIGDVVGKVCYGGWHPVLGGEYSFEVWVVFHDSGEFTKLFFVGLLLEWVSTDHDCHGDEVYQGWPSVGRDEACFINKEEVVVFEQESLVGGGHVGSCHDDVGGV